VGAVVVGVLLGACPADPEVEPVGSVEVVLGISHEDEIVVSIKKL